MARKRLSSDESDKEEQGGGAYFDAPRSVQTFTSGCAVLDGVLGGGWAIGRMANLVGDSGSGKSLLAIEGAANFLREFEDGKVWYVETEAAFDDEYVASLGIPIEKIDREDEIYTVEGLFKHMEDCIEETKEKGVTGFYIVDSLDALSDEAEMDREIDAGSFGASKAKKLSELFRRVNKKMSQANVTILIVSQVRDNINAAFGEKHTRAGGKALKFYCSQEVWLAYTGQIKQTISGVENVVGVHCKAKTKKNRVGPPFRSCDFDIIFNYGVDDIEANLTWLKKVKALPDKFEPYLGANGRKKLNKLSDDDFFETKQAIHDFTSQTWNKVESSFRPSRRKY